MIEPNKTFASWWALRRVAAIALLATVFAGLAGCLDLSGNEVTASIASPSGALHAVAFRRDCGATTRSSTELSILAAGEELPPDGGNALILDNDEALELRWISDTELAIKAPRIAKLLKLERVVAGVRLRIES